MEGVRAQLGLCLVPVGLSCFLPLAFPQSSSKMAPDPKLLYLSVPFLTVLRCSVCWGYGCEQNS